MWASYNASNATVAPVMETAQAPATSTPSAITPAEAAATGTKTTANPALAFNKLVDSFLNQGMNSQQAFEAAMAKTKQTNFDSSS